MNTHRFWFKIYGQGQSFLKVCKTLKYETIISPSLNLKATT